MNTLTVVKDDNLIILDGETINFAFNPIYPNLHAVQWNGISGHIEFKIGANIFIDNVFMVQPYIDQFNAEKARLAALNV